MAGLVAQSICANGVVESARLLLKGRKHEVQVATRCPLSLNDDFAGTPYKGKKGTYHRSKKASSTISLPARGSSRRQTQCRAASADGLKRREYRIEDLQSPDVHSLLKSNFHKFRPIEADEHHWDRQSFHQSQDSEPGPSRHADSESDDIGIPVYVMLPLDTIRMHTLVNGRTISAIQNEVALEVALHTLREAGVTGVMVDVWWGIIERYGPGIYDFTAYRRLFHKIASAGLKIQAVMSFHAAGANVGDTCTISLPRWVLDVGDRDPDIFYTDKAGHRNRECLSIGCDHEPIFWGRTPLMVYESFMRAFCDEFQHLFGEVVTEITLGCGPAGELRYPAYPEGDRRWRFPGVGEFQCYDKYMLAELKEHAEACNQPEWGLSGPHDAGSYCSRAEHTGFFHPEWGSWKTPYGQFFLKWYSSKLTRHAESMLSIAKRILEEDGRPRELKRVVKEDASRVSFSFQPTAKLGLKLAGVHWGYRTAAHAAELTAGYWNTLDHNGYEDIFQLVKKYDGVLSFTCVEMRDCEHPPEGACSPEGLLEQIIQCSERNGVPLTGENALQRYDHHGLQRIRDGAMRENANRGRLSQLTFLRMGHLMFDHWGSFTNLVHEMARLWPQYQPEEPELVDVDWEC